MRGGASEVWRKKDVPWWNSNQVQWNERYFHSDGDECNRKKMNERFGVKMIGHLINLYLFSIKDIVEYNILLGNIPGLPPSFKIF